MKIIKGKAVYEGVALGKIRILKKQKEEIERVTVEDVAGELERVRLAKEEANRELQELYDKALAELGEENAAIIQIQQMMLEDEDYQEAIEDKIQSLKVNAEYAVSETGTEFAFMFASMDDEYMKARAADVKDITGRIVDCLQGDKKGRETFEEPVILLAEDLSPSETVVLDKSKILAFATVYGSANSHTAILARTMNIPALIGVDMNLDELENGAEAVVDGFAQEFIIHPNEEQKEKARQQIQEELEKQHSLKELVGKETVTQDGKKINLYANVGSVEDVKTALENDAEGIGLFRSEFLYLGRNQLPDEEEQFRIYKQAAEEMQGKRLIIRTLDIGADKQADYLHLDKEENPALGYRAIRICLSQPAIFKTQLRALYRASVYGQIAIMYPMIISVEEVEAIQRISGEVKKELKAENIPYRDVEEGIMIETPAAVMISDELAKLVDFFSVGTNDLTQYTLAIDRQNDKLDTFYNPHHKAVLKLIQIAAENAHKEGKWIGICGELAADTQLTEQFVRMGIDELSVAPASILKLRRIIRQIK